MVNDQGHLLGFNDMTCRYSLAPHHRVIGNHVTKLILSLIDEYYKIHDWMLQKGNIVIPMDIKITTHSVYSLRGCCNLPLWFQEHANALWHLYKTQSWWKNRLMGLWSSGLSLKQQVFLWKCLLGVHPSGSNLQN